MDTIHLKTLYLFITSALFSGESLTKSSPINSFDLSSKFPSLRTTISDKGLTYDNLKINSLTQTLDESFNVTESSIYSQIDYASYELRVFDGKGETFIDSNILLETCSKYTILLFPANETNIDYILLKGIMKFVI